MSGPARPRLRAADDEDQAARWDRLRFQYPQASYSRGGDGWLYGALRDEDVPLRCAGLSRLIDALLAREEPPR